MTIYGRFIRYLHSHMQYIYIYIYPLFGPLSVFFFIYIYIYIYVICIHIYGYTDECLTENIVKLHRIRNLKNKSKEILGIPAFPDHTKDHYQLFNAQLHPQASFGKNFDFKMRKKIIAKYFQ